jgi:hypothetical protein
MITFMHTEFLTLKESRKSHTREFCITVHQEERRAGRLTKGRTDQNRFTRTNVCLILDIYDSYPHESKDFVKLGMKNIPLEINPP